MKKVLTLFAIFAMVGLVSCKKDPVQATITASDVTVEEGSTVKINATTTSSATITYASDNTAVATVAADGTVTGVKAGTANITLKVAAVKDEFTAAEKTIKATVTAKATPDPDPEPDDNAAITIDGNFEDWAALPAGTFSQSFGSEEATHPALTKCKVYADADFIYVYFEWDTDAISAVPGEEHVPFHCYINSDNNPATGGYGDQFAEACSDVLLEGFIYGGGEEGGELGSYDPGVHTWSGETGANGWSRTELLGSENGVGEGAGVEGKYEFKIDRSVLAGLNCPVADTFGIGFDIQQSWDSVGILPSTAPDESNSTGYLPLIVVNTQH